MSVTLVHFFSLRRAVIVELLQKNRMRAVRWAGHSTSRCLIARRTSLTIEPTVEPSRLYYENLQNHLQITEFAKFQYNIKLDCDIYEYKFLCKNNSKIFLIKEHFAADEYFRSYSQFSYFFSFIAIKILFFLYLNVFRRKHAQYSET